MSKEQDRQADMEARALPARRRKARHYALQALYQWHMAGQSLIDIETQFHADYDMRNVDTEYFSAVLHGVPAELKALQDLFEPALDRGMDELDPVELALLRMGTWELMCRLDIPYKVAINENVNLAKRFGASESYRYINGVLDKVAAQTRAIEVAAQNRSPEA